MDWSCCLSSLGTYNLENGLTRGLGPACLSSFKSTSKRDAFATQKTNVSSFLFDLGRKRSGKYRLDSWSGGLSALRKADRRTSTSTTAVGSFDPVASSIWVLHQYFCFRRRHYLAISAPAVPPAADPPFPGPGAYELRDFKEPEKKYMSTAAFVSNTSRWTIDTTVAAQLPGPASYTPYSGPPKQSFNFNFERKWIWWWSRISMHRSPSVINRPSQN